MKKDTLLKLYHQMPQPVRSLAASLQGFYLRSWRYGPETDRLLEEALERETWTQDRWKTWQEEHLLRLLHRAATQVPYYREYWAVRRRQGDKASWDYLENWPILEKDALREKARAFLADGCDMRRMYQEGTSGSTGKPLSVWFSREAVREVSAWSEARIRSWHGVSRHDRWAMVAGQLVTPVSQKRPPFWVWNQGLRQLYMSSYHLAPNVMGAYLDALAHYRVVYLHGYSSSLYALAQAVLDSKRTDVHMAVVFTSAEPLYEYQRAAIEEAFRCPVRETYGMAEMVAMASECAAGRLHLWPEVGHIEILQDGRPMPNGHTGDLVCTGLVNTDMPLIRYRIGDRGCLANDGAESCACGRTLPVMESVEGRISDILYTKDGRRIGRLSPVFKGDLAIREAQIVQESLDRIKVRFVPTPGFSSHHEQVIAQRLKERMGEVEIVMEEMKEIPRGPSGKFRAVICKLPEAHRPSGS